jgi:hypothetical protein
LNLVVDECSDFRKTNEALFKKVQDLERMRDENDKKHKQMSKTVKDHGKKLMNHFPKLSLGLYHRRFTEKCRED